MTCFNDTCEWLEELVKHKPREARLANYHLCHGIVTGCTHGIVVGGEVRAFNHGKYAHAWIEFQGATVHHSGLCIHEGKQVKCWCEFNREEYYAEFKIEDVTRYTIEEVCEQNDKHKTYGPWEDKYLALCKKGLRHEDGK
jgi:hypothetical protein